MIGSSPSCARVALLSVFFSVGSLAGSVESLAGTETADSASGVRVRSYRIELSRRSVGTLTDPVVLATEDKLDELEKALRLREEGEPERKRLEQEQKDADEQREKEEKARLEKEEARLAPICEPLKNRVIVALKNSGAGQGSFERIQEQLLSAKEQMPTSCPSGVVMFDGSVAAIIRCYNDAFLIKLANGEQYVGTKETLALNGLPQRAREIVIGITDQHYFCIQSTAPLVVLPGRRINAMLRKKQ